MARESPWIRASESERRNGRERQGLLSSASIAIQRILFLSALQLGGVCKADEAARRLPLVTGSQSPIPRFLISSRILFGIGLQAQFFLCSRCHFILSSKLAFLGILLLSCHFLFIGTDLVISIRIINALKLRLPSNITPPCRRRFTTNYGL